MIPQSLIALANELAAKKPEHEQYAAQYQKACLVNVPMNFVMAELAYRGPGQLGTRKLNFLARDCWNVYGVYDANFNTNCAYVKFSRKAAQNPDALEYLSQFLPGTFVDLSSTGATWERLSKQVGMDLPPEVWVYIYSDLFHYTPTKPTPPLTFEFLTRNSTMGQTTTTLEMYNTSLGGELQADLTSENNLEWNRDLLWTVLEPFDRVLEQNCKHIAEELHEWKTEELKAFFEQAAMELSK